MKPGFYFSIQVVLKMIPIIPNHTWHSVTTAMGNLSSAAAQSNTALIVSLKKYLANLAREL